MTRSVKKITILIADDHPFFRKGLRQMLAGDRTVTVIAEASSGTEALERIRKERPALAVLDIDMPGMRGLDVLSALSAERITTGVIFMTMYKEPELVRRAVALGALGYLLKESVIEEMEDCLRYVRSGRTFISPAMAAVMAGAPAEPSVPGLSQLTPAERRVLRLVAQDKSSKEIADALHISPRTVDNHRTHICEKLGLSGTHALVRFALQHQDHL